MADVNSYSIETLIWMLVPHLPDPQKFRFELVRDLICGLLGHSKGKKASKDINAKAHAIVNRLQTALEISSEEFTRLQQITSYWKWRALHITPAPVEKAKSVEKAKPVEKAKLVEKAKPVKPKPSTRRLVKDLYTKILREPLPDSAFRVKLPTSSASVSVQHEPSTPIKQEISVSIEQEPSGPIKHEHPDDAVCVLPPALNVSTPASVPKRKREPDPSPLDPLIFRSPRRSRRSISPLPSPKRIRFAVDNYRHSLDDVTKDISHSSKPSTTTHIEKKPKSDSCSSKLPATRDLEKKPKTVDSKTSHNHDPFTTRVLQKGPKHAASSYPAIPAASNVIISPAVPSFYSALL